MNITKLHLGAGRLPWKTVSRMLLAILTLLIVLLTNGRYLKSLFYSNIGAISLSKSVHVSAFTREVCSSHDLSLAVLDRPKQWFERSRTLDSSNRSAQRGLALVYLLTGDWHSLANVNSNDPAPSPQIEYMRGIALRELGRLPQALSAWQISGAKPCWAKLGEMLLIQDRLDDAQYVYGHMVEVYPDYPEGYYGLAAVFDKRGLHEKSLALLLEAYKLDTRSYKVIVGVGVQLYQLQHYQDATIWFQEAIRISPTSAAGYYQIAKTLRAIGDLDHATQYLQKSLQIYPSDPAALILQGEIYEAQERYCLALRYYRLALKSTDLGSTAYKRIETRMARVEKDCPRNE